MDDRTSKLLLALIAIGLWINIALQVATVGALNDSARTLAFVEQWLIRGAPVSANLQP